MRGCSTPTKNTYIYIDFIFPTPYFGGLLAAFVSFLIGLRFGVHLACGLECEFSHMNKIEFGIDGIRCRMDDPVSPLTRETAFEVGRALAQFAAERSARSSVVIGRDTRPSGTWLSESLAMGMLAEGMELYDLGIITTPGVAFVTRNLPATLGICVSASHSPIEYNGLKVVGERGLRLQSEQEMQIEALIQKCLDAQVKIERTHNRQTSLGNMVEIYIGYHVNHCQSNSPRGMRLVLDCANGAGSIVAPRIFRDLGATVFEMNANLQGHIINHNAGSEYARDSPQAMVQALQDHDAEYGLAFDGDGDRLVVVDRKSNVFDGDDLLYVLARHYKQSNLLRHDTVVLTDLSNRGLIRTLEQQGIHAALVSKGDKALEAALWGGGYLLGGEPTGNIIFNDAAHSAADAIYTGIVLMQTLKETELTLADSVAGWREHKCPQIIRSSKIVLPPKRAMWKELEVEAKRAESDLGPDSRVSTWLSSTEPGVLRLMVEGGFKNTQEQVQTQMMCLEEIVARYASR